MCSHHMVSCFSNSYAKMLKFIFIIFCSPLDLASCSPENKTLGFLLVCLAQVWYVMSDNFCFLIIDNFDWSWLNSLSTKSMTMRSFLLGIKNSYILAFKKNSKVEVGNLNQYSFFFNLQLPFALKRLFRFVLNKVAVTFAPVIFCIQTKLNFLIWSFWRILCKSPKKVLALNSSLQRYFTSDYFSKQCHALRMDKLESGKELRFN